MLYVVRSRLQLVLILSGCHKQAECETFPPKSPNIHNSSEMKFFKNGK